MSLGFGIPWKKAFAVAAEVSEELAPLVVQSKAVGSLRRRRPVVGDIEFLVEPRRVQADLFGGTKPDLQPIRDLAERWGRIVKAGDRMIQVSDFHGIEGLKVELYMVHPPANWWCLMAIRTGPADLGRQAVILMRDRGLRHEGGRILRRDGSEHPVESEDDFFAAAGLEYFPPHLRDERAALVPTAEV